MAKVKHIQCNTLPGTLDPGAIYFVKDTGEIVVTDESGVAKRYGGDDKVVKTNAIYSYDARANVNGTTDFGVVQPVINGNRIVADLRDWRNRLSISFIQPEKLSKIYIKNGGYINVNSFGLDGTNLGAKYIKIYGVRSHNGFPYYNDRRYPIPDSVLLFDGEAPKLTNINDFFIINVNTEDIFIGIAIDFYDNWSQGSSNVININKIISVKK